MARVITTGLLLAAAIVAASALPADAQTIDNFWTKSLRTDKAVDPTAGGSVDITGSSVSRSHDARDGSYRVSQQTTEGSFIEAHGQCYYVSHDADGRGDSFIPLKPGDFQSFLNAGNAGRGHDVATCCGTQRFVTGECDNTLVSPIGTSIVPPGLIDNRLTAVWALADGSPITVQFQCDGTRWQCNPLATIPVPGGCPAGTYGTPSVPIDYSGAGELVAGGYSSSVTLSAAVNGATSSMNGVCKQFDYHGPGGETIDDQVLATDWSTTSYQDTWSIGFVCSGTTWTVASIDGCSYHPVDNTGGRSDGQGGGEGTDGGD